MLELDAGIWRCEVPICGCVIGIAVVDPGGDLVDQRLFVGDAPVKTLGRQNAEFGFRQIEPTTVLWREVPFEALDQPPGFAAGKAS